MKNYSNTATCTVPKGRAAHHIRRHWPDGLALDLENEAELVLDLIERALQHGDLILSTSQSEIDDDGRDTYRRVLMRYALTHALVAIKGERKRRQKEEDFYLCVGGGR